MLDRGGAPLHFLLAHVALAFDTTPETLRWVSVVFALATVPLCYDLARRLAGPSAGIVAALLTATSQLLLIYGTFGRMYSLFAFTSALAADLFLRALERPRRRTALAATVAALLPLTVHPFGAFLFATEAAVALWLWRGRDLRVALPVVGVALLALPLVLVDLRLSDRYAPEAGQNLDSGTSTGIATLHALGGAAGGGGAVLVAFAVLAAAGILALARSRPAIAVFIGLTLAIPPLLLAIAHASGLASDRLAPRHLIFMLPLWIGLVAAGATHRRPLPLAGTNGAPCRGSRCRRVRTERRVRAAHDFERRATGSRSSRRVARDSARSARRAVSLFAGLPRRAARGEEGACLCARTGRTRAGRRANRSRPERLRLDPVAGTRRADAFKRGRIRVHVFPSWLIAESRGPFADGTAALEATAVLLQAISPLVADGCATVRRTAAGHGLRRARAPRLVLLAGRDFDRRRVAPQLFEAVIGARVRREDVQHDVEVVGDDPGRLSLAVDRRRQQALLSLQPTVHLVVDRGRLPRVLARAHDEVVGVGACRPHVENDDVLRQLVLGEAGDAAGLFEWRQCGFNSRSITGEV